jgi:beta-lactamase regulating signal transducer with metallopeptidase domain
MNDFLLLWLSLSLSGSLVAVTLILLKPLLRRFSKTWQYYVWLLVVLRLLIPISPDVSIVGEVFRQAETHFAAEYTPAEEIPESGFFTLPESPNAPGLENNSPLKVPTTTVAFSFWNNHIWGALWLIVSMALLFRKVYGYWQLVKTVKKDSHLVVDVQLLTALELVSTEMGIKKQIPVYKNSLIRTPMLIGVIRPSIIVPAKMIPPSELMYIFRHELTHYRRIDFLYKWLVEITVCLHWFNPLAYWMRKQINRNCEFSCDEAVVTCLSNAERQIYGDTLLNSIAVNHLRKKGVVSLSLNEDGLLIKERLCAIMQYRRKSKGIALAAVVLTSVLLCGTVFAGAYTVAAAEQVQTSTAARPIRISSKEITSGGKISLGSQQLVSGIACRVLLTWAGTGKLTIICTPSNGTENLYSIENGKVVTFQIPASGEYTVAVKNNNATNISNVNGTIEFNQSAENQQPQSTSSPILSSELSVQSIVYENVEMRRYEGKDGHPYIHDTITNGTKKGIEGYQNGMLAFDKDGNPLKIKWWSLDAEAESTFFYLDETSTHISPIETYDVHGGWSLNFFGNDSAVGKLAYVLYNNKEVVFDDGTVWINPDFEKWRTTYEGQKIDVNILENYYPYKQKIIF